MAQDKDWVRDGELGEGNEVSNTCLMEAYIRKVIDIVIQIRIRREAALKLYEPEWKAWICRSIRAHKPPLPPIPYECRKRAIVQVACEERARFALIPNRTEYAHRCQRVDQMRPFR
jgi:hypothetical protein